MIWRWYVAAALLVCICVVSTTVSSLAPCGRRSPVTALGKVVNGVVAISAESPALPLLIQHCVILLTERIQSTLGPNADEGMMCTRNLLASGCALSFQARSYTDISAQMLACRAALLGRHDHLL